MNDINKYLLKYDAVAFVIDSIKDTHETKGAKYCYRRPIYSRTGIDYIYRWTNTAAMFAYFCYIVTKVCAKNGLNIYKGKLEYDKQAGCFVGKIDMQRFRKFFPKYLIVPIKDKESVKIYKELFNKEIDRKTLQDITAGYEPKGAAELKKIVQKNLQKFFIPQGNDK